MRLYELHLLYNCDLTAEQTQEAVNTLCANIAKAGGKIVKSSVGDLIVLKYKIKKSNVARYAYIAMEYQPALVAELENTLKFIVDLHRHMLNVVASADAFESVSFEIANEKDYRQRAADFWTKHATFKHPNILRLLTTERGKILPRKSVQYLTKFCTDAFMRQIKVQIKIARKMAWLPYF